MLFIANTHTYSSTYELKFTNKYITGSTILTVRAGHNILGTIQIENYDVTDNNELYNVKDRCDLNRKTTRQNWWRRQDYSWSKSTTGSLINARGTGTITLIPSLPWSPSANTDLLLLVYNCHYIYICYLHSAVYNSIDLVITRCDYEYHVLSLFYIPTT